MFFAQCEIDGTKNIAKHGMKKFVQFRSEFIKTFAGRAMTSNFFSKLIWEAFTTPPLQNSVRPHFI